MLKHNKRKALPNVPAMKPHYVVLAWVLSAVIAVATHVLVEKTGYADKLSAFISAIMGSMQDVSKAADSGYVKSIKTIIVLLFCFALVYVILFSLVFEAIAIIYLILSSKWRNPAVFISYKYTDGKAPSNTNAIALDIKEALERKRFPVRHFEYTKKMDHDSVNAGIKKKLKQAHSLIAVPDPYHPSYVNAEILYAFYTDKPIFIIRHTQDQKLPDTANTGHTVLLLDELKKEQYKPLFEILQYVHKVWHTRLFLVEEPLSAFMAPFAELEDDNTFLKTVGIVALLVAALMWFDVRLEVILIPIKIIVAGIGVVAGYITMKEIHRQLQLRKVVKQLMINSGNTYDFFVEAKFNAKTLACIDKIGLENTSPVMKAGIQR